MSRTYRRLPQENSHFRKYYRRPRTYNEIRKLDSLIDDEFTPRNRDKARGNNLPTFWDDIKKSASYEDYDFKHYHESD
jgi:hypothetical protein